MITSLIGNSWGPVDGYRRVVEVALELVTATPEQAVEMGVNPGWVERHNLDEDPELKQVVVDVFEHPKGRKASEGLYAAGLRLETPGADERRSRCSPEMGIDIQQLFLDRGVDATRLRTEWSQRPPATSSWLPASPTPR